MKKLSLRSLKLEANDLLQREQLKSVFGGYDGFDCAYRYIACDAAYPNDYNAFNNCMLEGGC